MPNLCKMGIKDKISLCSLAKSFSETKSHFANLQKRISKLFGVLQGGKDTSCYPLAKTCNTNNSKSNVYEPAHCPPLSSTTATNSREEDEVLEEVPEDYITHIVKSQEKMNALRFRNWSERQWFDNNYVDALRDSLNRYDAQGNYIGESDFPCIPYAKNRFVVLESIPFQGGGLYMAFVFERHLDEVYLASVFSNCDEYEQ